VSRRQPRPTNPTNPRQPRGRVFAHERELPLRRERPEAIPEPDDRGRIIDRTAGARVRARRNYRLIDVELRAFEEGGKIVQLRRSLAGFPRTIPQRIDRRGAPRRRGGEPCSFRGEGEEERFGMAEGRPAEIHRVDASGVLRSLSYSQTELRFIPDFRASVDWLQLKAVRSIAIRRPTLTRTVVSVRPG
jgi:hypothetical protein